MAETWIVFKASPDAEGWEDRKLVPRGSLTDILAEEIDWSGRLPNVGDRVREFTNLSDPDNGATHGRDGDWVVSKIHQFSSFDTEQRIVVCHCTYQPISAEWHLLKRGAPVNDLLHPLQQ